MSKRAGLTAEQVLHGIAMAAAAAGAQTGIDVQIAPAGTGKYERLVGYVPRPESQRQASPVPPTPEAPVQPAPPPARSEHAGPSRSDR